MKLRTSYGWIARLHVLKLLQYRRIQTTTPTRPRRASAVSWNEFWVQTYRAALCYPQIRSVRRAYLCI